MAAIQNLIDFDYEQSKAGYMAQIARYFDEDSTHSEKTIKSTIQLLKEPNKTYLHKNYEVSLLFGREILIEKRKSPADPIVQVLTHEDVFDVFMKYHMENQHKGGRQYLTQVQQKLQISGTIFRYPVVCLSLLVQNCNLCKPRPRKPNKNLNNVSSVYVTIMINRHKMVLFRYLLIYIDKATDYVVIRPLKKKTEIEIAMEIFKILLAFGPPQKLRLYGYNCDFYKKVGIFLRQVCPMFNFAIEYKPANFDPSAVVVDKLQEWMNLNRSISWEIGCSMVQNQLNMEARTNIQLTKGNQTPHDLFFGKTHTIIAKPAASHILDKKKTNAPSYRNLETLVVDDDIVELRIPSPENYDQDLLSQFEESEASQEFIGDIVVESYKNELLESGDAQASNALLGIQNIVRTQDSSEGKIGTIQSNKEKEIDKRVKHVMTEKKTAEGHVQKKNGNKEKRKQTLRSIDFNDPDEFIDLDLNCEEPFKSDDELEKERIAVQNRLNRKMSLRSAKTKTTIDLEVDDDEENLIEDEDLIYNLDDVNIEDAIDPLHIEEESTKN